MFTSLARPGRFGAGHLCAVGAVLVLLFGCSGASPPPGQSMEPAAVVDGREIPRALVDEAVAELGDVVVTGISPDEHDGHIDALERDVLAAYIAAEVIRSAAERENIAVSDRDVDDARERLVDLLGGEDQVADALRPHRLTLDMFREVLVVQEAYLEGLRELVSDERELIEYVIDAFGESEIVIDAGFGEWDPGLREIVP